MDKVTMSFDNKARLDVLLSLLTLVFCNAMKGDIIASTSVDIISKELSHFMTYLTKDA